MEPSDNNNYALKGAIRNKHYSVVKMLLEDLRTTLEPEELAPVCNHIKNDKDMFNILSEHIVFPKKMQYNMISSFSEICGNKYTCESQRMELEEKEVLPKETQMNLLDLYDRTKFKSEMKKIILDVGLTKQLCIQAVKQKHELAECLLVEMFSKLE